MYCYNCGKHNQENDIFCFNCGVRLIHPVAVVPKKKDISEESKENVRSTLKKHLRSPMLLVAVILMTLSLVLSFLPAGTESYYEDVPEYDDFDDGFASPLSYTAVEQTGYGDAVLENIVFSVLGFTSLNLIWVIALWLTYFFALTKKPEMKLGGLAMLSVVGFINRIRNYVIVGLVAFSVILMCIAFATEDTFAAVFTFMLSVPLIGGLGFLAILWSHKLHKTLKNIKNIYETGNADQTISLFAAVMCFVSAAVYVMMIMTVYGYLAMLSSALSGASLILIGILILRLRGAMSSLAKEQKESKIPAFAGQIINNNEYMI